MVNHEILPNHNYMRGRAREYQVMNSLRKDGWVCSRSAMSHGPVDIFAARSGKVLLIQVKSGSARVTKEELDLLMSYAKEFRADAEVWSFKKRGVIQKTRVDKRLISKAEHKKSEPMPVIAREPTVSEEITAPKLELPRIIIPPS
jgi:Holliday junction resolvase